MIIIKGKLLSENYFSAEREESFYNNFYCKGLADLTSYVPIQPYLERSFTSHQKPTTPRNQQRSTADLGLIIIPFRWNGVTPEFTVDFGITKLTRPFKVKHDQSLVWKGEWMGRLYGRRNIRVGFNMYI